MKLSLIAAATAAALAFTLPAVAVAGPVENACNRSDRPGATRAMCRCIDQVARQHLTRAEQRRAARFFRDPQMAQDVRMSRAPGDSDFWRRYRAFGAAAESACSR
ncbi:MAG: hypothetical protein JJU19_14695 [Pararhodobacter sp.]|nr:hypothetical protein [Pararhodobacter sp.]